MISKEDMTKWAEIWTPVGVFFGFLWHKISALSAKWDGFKFEYDKAQKGQSRAEGQLERIDMQDAREDTQKALDREARHDKK